MDLSRLRLSPVHSVYFAEANARLKQKVGHRVIFFGDSRIDGWEPKPDMGSTELLFRGIPGETTAQMRFRFAADVVELDPEVVVIQAGINDVVAAAALGDPDEAQPLIVANLRHMIDTATASGIGVILMTVVRPAAPAFWRIPVWSSRIYDSVSRLNAMLRHDFGSVAKILDADALLSPEGRPLQAPFARDTLHFTPAAYVVLNQRLNDLLRVDANATQ